MKVSLATLHMAGVPPEFTKAWGKGHDPGEQVPLAEALNWFQNEKSIESAEWLFLEITPLEALLEWLSQTLWAWIPEVPQAYQDRCGLIATAIDEGVWLPPRFWDGWGEGAAPVGREGLLKAYRMAGNILPLDRIERRARSQVRTIHSSLRVAINEIDDAASPDAARLLLLNLAIPAVESVSE